MLCPLWDPIVFTIVEYVLAKVSRKVFKFKIFLETLATILLPNVFPLWDPIVFTIVEYILGKVSRKGFKFKNLCIKFS